MYTAQHRGITPQYEPSNRHNVSGQGHGLVVLRSQLPVRVGLDRVTVIDTVTVIVMFRVTFGVEKG